jgi:hypothetical protein
LDGIWGPIYKETLATLSVTNYQGFEAYIMGKNQMETNSNRRRDVEIPLDMVKDNEKFE